MKRWLAGCLGLSLGLWSGTSRSEEVVWRPVRNAGAPAAQPLATLGAPLAALGRPVLMHAAAKSREEGAEESASRKPIVRAQGPGYAAPTLGPPPPMPMGGAPMSPVEQYNCGVVTNPPGGSGQGFFGKCWDKCKDCEWGSMNAGTRSWFQSDPCFPEFISPVSNPFLFEDPRALTELRPIFIYQLAPKSNWIYNGGNVWFFGTQARLAFTERLSLTMNKFGGMWTDPKAPVGEFQESNGIAEIWLTPKWTFLRNENSKTLGAFGLMFQIPAGPKKIQQDTDNLSLMPFVSFAQNFGQTSYGSFNAMYNFGYSFGIDNKRSDYLNNSLHLDFNVGNANKIYPLVEMNWTNYTQAGTARDIGFEGRDLFNFGSQGVSGNNIVTIGPGVRYKFTEGIQAGVITEFPLTGRRDLEQFRVTADMIFRY